MGWGTALLATQEAIFRRIVASRSVFPVRIRKRSGAENEAFVGRSPDAAFLDGGDGGVAHPPIVVPRAPVALQGAEGGAAQRGEATTSMSSPPASAGRIPSAKRSGRKRQQTVIPFSIA
ncbi:MAG: hypothetical protein ACYCT9_11615 [Leptospirillum sp.]